MFLWICILCDELIRTVSQLPEMNALKKDGYYTVEILRDLSMWLMVNGLFLFTFKCILTHQLSMMPLFQGWCMVKYINLIG